MLKCFLLFLIFKLKCSHYYMYHYFMFNKRMSNVLRGTRNINNYNSVLNTHISLLSDEKTRRDIYLTNLDSFVQFNKLAYVIET